MRSATSPRSVRFMVAPLYAARLSNVFAAARQSLKSRYETPTWRPAGSNDASDTIRSESRTVGPLPIPFTIA